MFRVKGSTIIEALVAMTITIIVFGATLSLFMNVGRDMNQPLKAAALVQIGNEMNELKKSKVFQPGKYSRGNITIEKKIEKQDARAELSLLTITAMRKDNGSVLLQRRILMLSDELVVKTEVSDEQ